MQNDSDPFKKKHLAARVDIPIHRAVAMATSGLAVGDAKAWASPSLVAAAQVYVRAHLESAKVDSSHDWWCECPRSKTAKQNKRSSKVQEQCIRLQALTWSGRALQAHTQGPKRRARDREG